MRYLFFVALSFWAQAYAARFDCTILLESETPALELTLPNVLTGKPVESVEEAEALIERVLTEPALRSALAAFFEPFGGVRNLRSNPNLWDLYLGLYDEFALNSPGYGGLMELADSVLPEQGLIADLGAGTGNFASALWYAAPERAMVLVDFPTNVQGFRRSQQKMQRVASHLQRQFDFERAALKYDLLEMTGTEFPQPLSAVICNNVTYSMERAKRPPVVRMAAQRLRPGGIFYLADPDRNLMPNLQAIRDAILTFLKDVIHQGARPSDFRFALEVYINTEILIGSSVDHLSTIDEMCTLLKEADLEIRKIHTNLYYRSVSAVVGVKN